MKKTVAALIVVAIIIVLAVSGLWHILNSGKPPASTPESLVVGLPSPLESSALVYIADDQHLFADNGLNVTIKEYDTGLHAVNDMLLEKNPVMAVAAEYIIVGKAFQQEKICGVASIARQEIFSLIGRKDLGIQNVSDLKGKKIGIAPGTISAFYVGRFLELHGISLQDVTIVDTLPAEFDDAIGNGSVDAISVWGDYIDSIKDRLGSDAIVWPDQSGQLTYWTAICNQGWAAEHPELINRFLKSLDQAAKYAVEHPAEAKAIMKKRLQASDADITSAWSNSQYSLSLDQSLITAMEDEGRWIIKNNLTYEKSIPDYKDYLYLKGLEEVKPESVNIIS
jgi:ABC-type nitrate/sulfonate/bicarbonate transport system substrate-binding protein